MLTSITLQNFKCFSCLKLPLAPLTLLSGTNASGKSSVLQSLILLNQTMNEHEWSTQLALNGKTLKLGTVTDTVDKVNGRHSMKIGVSDEQMSTIWTFNGARSDMSMKIEKIIIDDLTIDRPLALRYLLPPDQSEIALAKIIRSLTYITAERLGPREVYNLSDKESASVVGSFGENAASLLHWNRDREVLPQLALEDRKKLRLLHQVQLRMDRFFPGFTYELVQIPQTNAVRLGLRTSDDTDFHRPIHVGFGLTQLFPLIVAALMGREGNAILVENPEVHLHPAGQSLVGEFLCEIASAGIQVILESHSDHILNGIRKAVRGGIIEADKVLLHFFQQRSADAAQVTTPFLNKHGKLDSWPEGFFDQFDKDTSQLVDWGDI